MRILVTGGAGFIGSNFVRYMLDSYANYSLINLDLLTYAGNLENLKGLANNSHHRFVQGDICDQETVETLMGSGLDAVINFAAESHVDRSILDASAFLRTNIAGTYTLLEAARKHKVARFVQISTDEVYGSLGPQGAFTEQTPLAPNSPYAASKTSADLLVRAFYHTYQFPAVITRCSNNYGPYQFPEKLIPLLISNALREKPLPIYGDGLYVRDWLFVEDHCAAIDKVLHHGKAGEIYNIGGNNEKTNLEIVNLVLDQLKKSAALIRHVQDRPGHDRRYAIDAAKIGSELNWQPRVQFSDGMRRTIDWYVKNQDWVEHIRSGEYMRYYEKMYDHRSQTLQEL
ncbi:MAG: dTDP-glucose 4,6-dehydratase [Acidobacteria bacterium]|nr:dTDP-glucose 4,6-dehydratase [Acidobacteriota bacterium]MBI3656999.1 dTDP-glucose 4,6-dehydratase [Acidobacteriota bacterium]